MMNKNLYDPKYLVHNPLGIIGLFLVLVESIAALVVANSKLDPIDNRILVIFIVVFPLLVILIFYKLVTKHHQKLYSPKDYRDEETFKQTFVYDISQRKFGTSKNVKSEEDQYSAIIQENKLDAIELNVIKNIIEEVRNSQQLLFQQFSEINSIPLISENKLDIQIAELESVVELRNRGSFKILVSKGCTLDESKSNIYSFINTMRDLKYKAEEYITPKFIKENEKENRIFDRHEAIWLGKNVELEYAREVILEAINHFPQLKYIEVSDEDIETPAFVHDQIFLGGSTATAKERKLHVFSKKEILKFNDLDTLQELHHYINTSNY